MPPPPLLLLDPSIQKIRKKSFKEVENWILIYYSGGGIGGGGFDFRETEGKKIFETDHLAYAQTNANEVIMDVQKGSGTKDNYGPLSSVNPPISVAAPKPL